MTGAGDVSLFDRLYYGAAVLFGVGALGVSALPDIPLKIPHSVNKLILFKEIKALEVQHRKSRSVCDIAAIGAVGKGEEHNLTGGMPSSFYLSADLRGGQLKAWEESVEKGGLAYTRSPRKGGGLMRQISLYKLVYGSNADIFLGGQLEAGKARP